MNYHLFRNNIFITNLKFYSNNAIILLPEIKKNLIKYDNFNLNKNYDFKKNYNLNIKKELNIPISWKKIPYEERWEVRDFNLKTKPFQN